MEINLQNYKENNKTMINTLHPKVRSLFFAFENKCAENNTPLWIYSAFRSFSEQSKLRAEYLDGLTNIKYAPAGRSYSNYGLAIGAYIYNQEINDFNRNQSYELYSEVAQFAVRFQLTWMGNKNEFLKHNFRYDKIRISKLLEGQNRGLFDDEGYVLLDELEKEKTEEKRKKIVEKWELKVNENYSKKEEVEDEEKPKKKIRKIAKIEKKKAVGIWQIVKFVSDQYSLSQNINDASIAHSQGSLMNFIKNVVQEPWLEFFGDTVKDQYYFFARKQPFDYNGWTKLPNLGVVTSADTLSDSLDWYDGDVYSWYQIIPKGSFLGQQNLIFAYIRAVFFKEYAEIYGSKPNIQVSNYLNFIKIKGRSTMNEKAIEDLRYMVESNAYLPFTRKGTIKIKGTTKFKRGYKFLYHPTGEEFYIDSISDDYSTGEGGTEFTTVLQVSRGMKIENTKAPLKYNSKSYFNIIDFSTEKQKSTDKDKVNWKVKNEVFDYFLKRKQFAKS